MGYMLGLHEVHTTSAKFILLCDSVTDDTDIREADVIMLNFSKTFYSLLHRNSHSPTMRIKQICRFANTESLWDSSFNGLNIKLWHVLLYALS